MGVFSGAPWQYVGGGVGSPWLKHPSSQRAGRAVCLLARLPHGVPGRLSNKNDQDNTYRTEASATRCDRAVPSQAEVGEGWGWAGSEASPARATGVLWRSANALFPQLVAQLAISEKRFGFPSLLLPNSAFLILEGLLKTQAFTLVAAHEFYRPLNGENITKGGVSQHFG